LKILIVDDETLARERLARLLAKLQPEDELFEASDGRQALRQIEAHSPDLVLLDIRMPGIDGIEVAAKLEDADNPPAVIFCTAYDEYAMKALEHQAIAYLLKPARESELAKAIAKAGRVNRVQLASLHDDSAGAQERRAHVGSQTHRGIESLPLDQIRCFVAEQKYVTAYAQGAELLIPDTLKELEQEFSDQFLRVHRNALVALSYIVILNRGEEGNWYLELDGVSQTPQVSRRHLKAVKERLLSR